nr:ATP-binding protein [Bacteroidota bacterium]
MIRFKTEQLLKWKGSTNRKPLLIRGARQVGKTWLMKEFGKKHFAQSVYINFEKNKRLRTLFDEDFNVSRIILALQIETGVTIRAIDTLLIFDEIQAVPEAITALKYFYEDAPEYNLIAAGSLLGVALHSNFSFPVGKIEFMDLYPLTFIEFLAATGDSSLIDLLSSRDWKLINTFKTKYIERLRQYYYIGGMPEVVSQFCMNANYKEARQLQKQILASYDQDYSKHVPTSVVPRIRMVWNSVPGQLAKENRKFIYGLIKEGSRAKEYEIALSWLVDCGLAYKIHRVSKPGMPLKAYEDLSSFKLFMVDVGLLAAMGDIDAKTLLNGNAIFTEFKGAPTEQYVLQQLIGSEKYAIFYWSAQRSNAEVDFVVQYNEWNIPIEVKAEENLQAKSLKVYYDKFTPNIAIRTSMSDYRRRDWLINLPLYAISELAAVAGNIG